MFRNRPSAQKPSDELYAAFKQNFPEIGPLQNATTSSTEDQALSSATLDPSLTDTALQQRPYGDHDEPKDHGIADNWRFTPSILDPNAFSFGNFGTQGYYTPTPGGMNTVYHNQAAGDLHTPGMAFQLGTPLSMPVPDSSLNAGSFETQGFNPQLFQNQAFNPSNIYHQQQPQPQGFHPSILVHEDSGYAAIDGTPDNDADLAAGIGDDQVTQTGVESKNLNVPTIPSGEKLRYHVTLNAPTAMIKQPEEVPITYLNKGQAYTLSIVDSMPSAPHSTPLKYRTVIRISFEDDQQRQRPSACWQLWKEGRGLAEAHQRGGKLQAVEYVDPHPGAEEDPRRPRIELDNASFDCFSVHWTPSIATSSSECSIAVRFNFLSTDFSHSKGVKGIPVRLCAKTEVISTATVGDPAPEPEVCFCKVKLFRDHGAERKLANDVAHVKKTIDKLKQQIAQAEAGVKDFNKRKRTSSMAGRVSDRPAKVPKHRRTWSISSQGSSGRPAIEDDLNQKLSTVQDMFTSTRPVSVLYLKGLEEDDPDIFPVTLPGDPGEYLKSEYHRTGSWDQRQSDIASPTGSSNGSPDPSSRSNSGFKIPPRKSSKTGTWPLSATLPGTNFSAAMEQARLLGPIKIHRQRSGTKDSDDFEAIGIDPTYVAPPEQLSRPVACFYMKFTGLENSPDSEFYRAIYLMHRTLKDLISAVGSKSEIDPSRIQRCIRINSKGLNILVDDEVVRELREGQDMTIEFQEYDEEATETEVKQEALKPDAVDAGSVTPLGSNPLEMRLMF